MCASIKFLALLVFVVASQISSISANREIIGLISPYRTLLNDEPSPSPLQDESSSLPPYEYEPPFTWDEVRGSMSPCLPFLVGMDSDPSPTCCAGAKTLVGRTKTKRDEQELCLSLKLILPLHGPYDPKQLTLLGEKCDVNFPFPPIIGDTDCSK
ncbi:hypothetical protein F3Y22_tig00111779pilonHSYRG00147 [Hibiscus syriacus]|uniref:Bifunctional inhibitor/plant lipid transfer protein/seed storage helical domain-containing protein n=1 Tax=Hibiscus syriacus TaxID=106335 RepID=A0A6A2XUK3_HIBSY|nr:non-specific lipid-transfer protein-like [Hibiscus syriacus]KAE8673580.1 hypothetical protein F3Y22_tig00111779pilonHSYRG00147 [Hibiscus syriacus]